MPTPVTGSGPIGFTDKDGNQRFIPLSALEFSDYGEIQVKVDSEYTAIKNLVDANKDLVNSLLPNLRDNGFLRAGESPPAKPAMVLKSAFAGTAGNNVSVSFSDLKVNKDNLKGTTFAATIAGKLTYKGLKCIDPDQTSSAFIKKVLGTNKPQPGTSPYAGQSHLSWHLH